MTNLDDFFGQLDEADPVTDDQADSIRLSVKQTEADECRVSVDKTFYSATSMESRRRTISPRYVARCRFCRCKFKQHPLRRDTKAGVMRKQSHNVDTAARRILGDDPEIHLKTWEAYKRAEKRLDAKIEIVKEAVGE